MYSQKLYLYPVTLLSLLLGTSLPSIGGVLPQRLSLQNSNAPMILAHSQIEDKRDRNYVIQGNKGLWDDVKNVGEDVGEFGEDVGEDALEGGQEVGEDVGEFGEDVGEDAAEVEEDITE